MSLYLCHHGIKGQRWGVRRFQNYDGTLIRRNDEFSKAETDVTNKLSNKPNTIEKKSIDISEVIKRGKLTKAEANECSKLALTVFNKAAKKEPKITISGI